MLLCQLINTLEDKLPLTVVGKFSDAAAVRALRSFVPGKSEDDLLYVLGEDEMHPDADNEHLFKGFYILYNPDDAYVSPRCITVFSDIKKAEFANAVQEVFEEDYTVSSWFHSLYTMAIRSGNPKELLCDLHAAFRNHFILLSSSLYVVDSSFDSFEENPYFELRHERFYLSPRTVEHITASGLLEKAMKSDSAFETDDNFFGRPVIVSNIRLGNYVTGFFLTIQTEKEFTLRDPAMITFLSEVMGQMIYSNTTHLTPRYFNDEYFLETLLSPEGYDIDELSQFMHWDRYTDSLYYQLLVCFAPGDVRKRTSTHLSEQLRSIFPSSPVLVENNRVTVFFAGSKKPLVNSDDSKTLADIMKFQKQNGILSFCFSDLEMAASYHSHCVSLLKYLSEGKRKGELFLMEDHYFQMVIRAMGSGSTDEALIHPDILFLKQYDERKGSELTKTLTAYLKCNRSVALMSEKLHINKSTGFYRINQIKDLLDDPFSSSEKLFYYECALRFL